MNRTLWKYCCLRLLKLGLKRWNSFLLSLSLRRFLPLEFKCHAVRKPRLHEEAYVDFLANNASVGPSQQLASVTRYVRKQALESFSSSQSPSWGPRHCRIETNCPHYALSKFLDHEICKCDKEVFYATEFWGHLIHGDR